MVSTSCQTDKTMTKAKLKLHPAKKQAKGEWSRCGRREKTDDLTVPTEDVATGSMGEWDQQIYG